MHRPIREKGLDISEGLEELHEETEAERLEEAKLAEEIRESMKYYEDFVERNAPSFDFDEDDLPRSRYEDDDPGFDEDYGLDFGYD